MKISKIMFLSMCFFLLGSCAVNKWQNTLIQKGDMNDAINNAITDFVHTSKWSKKDSIFTVTITDINEENINITIAVADDDVYPNSKNKVGTYDHIFPTRYTVKEGKLFYWNDATLFITQDIISILEKYNHIDCRWSELSDIIGGVHNDGVEGVIYYFCKNDLTNYKKSDVSNIRKHYKIPLLKCN
jgi:hypothetical protein